MSASSRVSKADLNLTQHARNNGILPSYELPQPSGRNEQKRHNDDNIQTLPLEVLTSPALHRGKKPLAPVIALRAI